MNEVANSTQGHNEILFNNNDRDWQFSSSNRPPYNPPPMSSIMGDFPLRYNSMGQYQPPHYNPNMPLTSNTNFIPSTYGQNPQQRFGGMNPLPQQTNDSWNSYGITRINYNNMPKQQSHGIGPMRGYRGMISVY